MVINRVIVRHIFISVLMLVMSGCARFQPTRLVQYDKTVCSFHEQQHDVELTVKALGEKDFKDHFDAYQVLQVQVKNKSQHTYFLKPENIGLSLEPAQKVCKRAPSLYYCYFIPTIVFTVLGYFFIYEIAFPLAAVFGLWGGRMSRVQNKKECRKLKSTSLGLQAIEVKPFHMFETLLFVNRPDYKPHFTITLDACCGAPTLQFQVNIVAHQMHVYKTH